MSDEIDPTRAAKLLKSCSDGDTICRSIQHYPVAAAAISGFYLMDQHGKSYPVSIDAMDARESGGPSIDEKIKRAKVDAACTKIATELLAAAEVRGLRRAAMTRDLWRCFAERQCPRGG